MEAASVLEAGDGKPVLRAEVGPQVVAEQGNRLDEVEVGQIRWKAAEGHHHPEKREGEPSSSVQVELQEVEEGLGELEHRPARPTSFD